jgi:hypothetical protein
MFVKYMGGLAMPSDFPAEPFEAILETTRKHRESTLAAWGEFASGWNALCWRYKAAAEHDETFTRSVQQDGPGPEPEARYRQENQLFTFFVAGLSALEAFAYGMWALVWVSGDAAFALKTENDRKRVDLRTLHAKLALHYSATQLEVEVGRVVNPTNSAFEEWTWLRNTLAHRGSHGRHHQTSGPTGWARREIDGEPREIHIDVETTARRRAWLSTTLGELLEAAALFTRERFD